MNIDKAKLNEAIAQTCCRNFECCRCESQATIVKYGAAFCSDTCADRVSDFAIESGQEKIPDYCDDLNAAWQLVEWMRKEGFTFTIHNEDGPSRYMGFFDSPKKTALQYADTPALSICLAFCRVNQIPIPQLTA